MLAVGADRIVLFRRRSRLLLAAFDADPGIVLVGVDDRIVFPGSVLLHIRLPAARNADVIPRRIVQVDGIKAVNRRLCPAGWIDGPVKFPVVSIEQLMIAGCSGVLRQRLVR